MACCQFEKGIPSVFAPKIFGTTPRQNTWTKEKGKNMIADFIFKYDQPLVCTAIHNGHSISEEVKNNLGIPEDIRLKEEDSNTGIFTNICNNRIIGRISRFEFDINRSPEKAFYLKPEDAWGYNVRKETPSNKVIETSLKQYDQFYMMAEKHFKQMEKRFGKFFVYDIHSYNHHRKGPDAPYDDPEKNPEIIIGTNNMSEKWMYLVEDVQEDLLNFNYWGRQLDVRKNIKFPGGFFSRWIHNNFPDSACCIAIEFKKIFMDEWTGEIDKTKMVKLREALQSTLPGILRNLEL